MISITLEDIEKLFLELDARSVSYNHKKSVEYFTNVEEIIKRYKNELFLTPEELRKYERDRAKWHSRDRRPRPWMIVKLRNIKRYPKIVKPKRFIAVSGRYIKEKEYKEIRRKGEL